MKRDFRSLSNGDFDLLVIGGGIYGAWVAYDGALRGLKVALVEKGDWGSGASSASSKLVHGGLRYLEHFWFSLVRQSLRERELLLQLGPHRISPLSFLIPLYRKKGVHPFLLKAGLSLYDCMGKGGKYHVSESHKTFSKQEVINSSPFLSEKDLTGGYLYSDAQTDDARFTLEIVSGALKAGAVAVNYSEIKELIVHKNRVLGGIVENSEGHGSVEVKASVTVNAAGPWASTLKGLPGQFRSKERLVKGVHLTVSQVHPSQAYLLTAPQDQRVFFLLPWYGRTLIGTTDSFFDGNPDDVMVTPQDKKYLLTAANAYFANMQLTDADIQASFAGLRVLPAASALQPASITRKWELYSPLPGLFMSTGGKLTSARQEADYTVDTIVSFTQKMVAPTLTDKKPFPWKPDETHWEEKGINDGLSAGLDHETAALSVRRYGSSQSRLLSVVLQTPGLGERIDPDFPFCKGEIVHAAQCEMACSLEDILRRRIPLAILTKLKQERIVEAADLVTPVLGWNDERKRREILAFQEIFNRS